MTIIPKEPRKVGLIDGKFYPCPEKHICISTLSDKNDEKHYIEPIVYNLSLEEAKSKIKSIIQSLKRNQLREEKENYLLFQFTTRLFRFKDDVEFLFDDTNKIIHFKSQSRIGGFDWNTNRNRMEKVRKFFMK